MGDTNDTLRTADERYRAHRPRSPRRLQSQTLQTGHHDPIMEPHAADKISAVVQLVKELKMDFATGDKEIARQIDAELEKSLAQASETSTKGGATVIPDGYLEKQFKKYEKLVKSNDARDALVEVLLAIGCTPKPSRCHTGTLSRPCFKNIQIALKYNSSLGLSTSKDANRRRADYFEKLAEKMRENWLALVDKSIQKFGDGNGSAISGSHREHFPASVKDRLRFLAHGKERVLDAMRLHKALAVTRSPIFK